MKYNLETIGLHTEIVKEALNMYPSLSSYSMCLYLKQEKHLSLSKNYVCKLMSAACASIAKDLRDKDDFLIKSRPALITAYKKFVFIHGCLKIFHNQTLNLMADIRDSAESIEEEVPLNERERAWRVYT